MPGLDEESSHSSKSDDSHSEADDDDCATPTSQLQQPKSLTLVQTNNILLSNSEDDEIGDGLRTHIPAPTANSTTGTVEQPHATFNAPNSLTKTIASQPGGERRRRKLPEIPKNKKRKLTGFAFAKDVVYKATFFLHPLPASMLHLCGQTSLADELTGRYQNLSYTAQTLQPTSRSVLAMKCGYLLDEDSSPDSDRLMHSLGDVDSGHSTAHSPNDFKSMSPSQSPFPPAFGGVPFSQLEMLEATHRALHKFIPRHHDEVDLEIGDPIYVQKEADDLWCEGVNLRTGKQGIFPSAYAVDLEYNDFDPETIMQKRERYLLGYLGSVETSAHKGTGVVCQAVKKIIDDSGESPKAQCCILEVSDQGLRMVERSRLQNHAVTRKGPCIDYFYSLKNVSFCAFHPRDHRYIGFITKHPTLQRFACHVFKGQESTRPVAEAVGYEILTVA